MRIEEMITRQTGIETLDYIALCKTIGGAEPASGSYAAGYAIGKWFNEMYHIWHYGLTHLTER